MGFLLALSAVFGTACFRESPLVSLDILRTTGGYHISLLAAPGARINARLKPALELASGEVLRFDSPQVTPDSSYFTGSPAAEVQGAERPRGRIRVAVCAPGEQVCRRLAFEVR